VWHGTRDRRDADTAASASLFLTELGWREFAYHTLFEHPELATVNIHREYDSFPWPPLDPSALRAWHQGRTGIPLVDAGMRELWRTGAMHNRVRMVTGSFLVKNLLIDWRLGEQWFWDTLVDADPASNAFNWQWVAGSGADAAPYFRVFNPELQRQKFDPHGDYVRRFVPELRGVAGAAVHTPWDLPDGIPTGYPRPIVDHATERRRALADYEALRR
jgi:deoxyribodipyrimidine photo-lyase